MPLSSVAASSDRCTLSRCDELESSVVGLLGSSLDRAHQTARRLAIPRVYHNLDELLDDSRVQVVHVASPNEHHFDQVKSVLEVWPTRDL